MTKIRKPVVDGVANRFHYRGSEYDVRQTKLGLQLYKDNRFYRNIPQYENESVTIDDIINDLETLKNNETIYQVFEYVGTSSSGQITIPEGSAIFDLYQDGIVIRLRRNAVAGNTNDTLDSNVVLTHFELVGHFWKP